MVRALVGVEVPLFVEVAVAPHEPPLLPPAIALLGPQPALHLGGGHHEALAVHHGQGSLEQREVLADLVR